MILAARRAVQRHVTLRRRHDRVGGAPAGGVHRDLPEDLPNPVGHRLAVKVISAVSHVVGSGAADPVDEARILAASPRARIGEAP
jgi:hypothetical protein